MSHQATPPQGEIYRDSISLIDKGGESQLGISQETKRSPLHGSHMV
jgi:hypothetical protein